MKYMLSQLQQHTENMILNVVTWKIIKLSTEKVVIYSIFGN